MRTTLTTLYRDVHHARDAMKHLLDAGVSRDDVSLAVNRLDRRHDPYTPAADVHPGPRDRYWRRGAVSARRGTFYGLLLGLVAGALFGVAAALLPWTRGAAVGASWGALLGGLAGALAGGLWNAAVPRVSSHHYARPRKRGATLLRVRLDETRLDEVRRLLEAHEPVDLHARRDRRRLRGWGAYDPVAEPLWSRRAPRDAHRGSRGTHAAEPAR